MSATQDSGDRLFKHVTQDQEAVLLSIDATHLVQESMERVGAWPPAMIHLGQALLGTALLHNLADHGSEKLEVQWKVDGLFGSLYTEARERGKLRGTVLNPKPDFAEIKSLHQPLGEGLLQVRRISAPSGQAFTGIVKARGDVTQDLLEYLERSEQKNCAMNLWVDIGWDESSKENPFIVRKALGYLVHILPQATEQKMNQVLYRWDQHLQALGSLSQWVFREDATLEILSFLSGQFKPQIDQESRVEFYCTCTEERAERALAILNQSEKVENTEATTEVRCEFCGRTYELVNPE